MRVTNHQGKADENHQEMPCHNSKDGCYKNKAKQKGSAGEDVEKMDSGTSLLGM